MKGPPLLLTGRRPFAAASAGAALLAVGFGAGGVVLGAGPAFAAPTAASPSALHGDATANRHRPRSRTLVIRAAHTPARLLTPGTTAPSGPAPALSAPRLLTTPPTATFQVSYSPGFPAAAQAAFSAAVDTWSHIVVSPVPIRVTADWSDLGLGVLGSAAEGGDDLRNGAWVPDALADAAAGSDLNPYEPDIRASFSSGAAWYTGGTGGTVPVGQYDMQSVVTHELAHGLGFNGSFDDTAGLGSFGGGTSTAFAFDNQVDDGSGRQVDLTYANNSLALDSVLNGSAGALRFGGARARAANGGVAPVLYTPAPYNGGSSVYHLDESIYPRGSANALMTPALADTEVVREPGPIVRGMLADIGWATGTVVPTAAPTPISARYAALGGGASVLGAPVGGEYAVPGGVAQNYTRGRMYYSAASGAHEVHGLILSDYLALGGPFGVLRLPTTDETPTPDLIGRYNHFSAGSVYWTPAASAHAVYGAIRIRWSQLGWERGRLGYPLTNEYAVPGGRRNDFQHGSITWVAATGAVAVTYR